MDIYDLLNPSKVFSSAEVFDHPCPILHQAGIYAWYFKEIPPNVPTTDCILFNNLALLYIGISPRPPSQKGNPPSRQTLYDRIRYHYSGNAKGSTLRLTLGCLLSEKLDIQLRKVGSGRRKTFTRPGEVKLTNWMSENAFVVWYYHPQPWILEGELINTISVPLNRDHNHQHVFNQKLAEVRKLCKEKADYLPIVNE